MPYSSGGAPYSLRDTGIAMSMTPELWKEIESLYHACVDREPKTRDSLLAKARAEVRAVVHQLLSQETPEILDQSAWEGETTVQISSPAIIPGSILGPYSIETSVGAGSYGPFQIQNPGESGGPHPDITVAQAEDPNYSSNYMSANYAQALSTVPNAVWVADPEKAAEVTDYRAEHPAETYFASQGRSRVDQAYKAAVKKMIDLGISTDFSTNP